MIIRNHFLIFSFLATFNFCILTNGIASDSDCDSKAVVIKRSTWDFVYLKDIFGNQSYSSVTGSSEELLYLELDTSKEYRKYKAVYARDTGANKADTCYELFVPAKLFTKNTSGGKIMQSVTRDSKVLTDGPESWLTKKSVQPLSEHPPAKAVGCFCLKKRVSNCDSVDALTVDLSSKSERRIRVVFRFENKDELFIGGACELCSKKT